MDNVSNYNIANITCMLGPAAEKMEDNKSIYSSVHENIPWWVVGIIHNMECSMNFRLHLHNGDSLTNRTRRVPAGRPPNGSPPFKWDESAYDALVTLKKLNNIDWDDLETTLDQFERYNGLGYRRRGVVSPYLFSGTDVYRSGKFVRDGVYDPAAISKQIGVVPFLKYFQIF